MIELADENNLKALNFINKIHYSEIIGKIFNTELVWIDLIPTMIERENNENS